MEALVPCGQYWDAADSVICVMHLTLRGTKCPGMLTHCWRVLMPFETILIYSVEVNV